MTEDSAEARVARRAQTTGFLRARRGASGPDPMHERRASEADGQSTRHDANLLGRVGAVLDIAARLFARARPFETARIVVLCGFIRFAFSNVEGRAAGRSERHSGTRERQVEAKFRGPPCQKLMRHHREQVREKTWDL